MTHYFDFDQQQNNSSHIDDEELESDPIKYAKRRISQELGYANDEESLRIKQENEELKRKLEEMSTLLSQQQQTSQEASSEQQYEEEQLQQQQQSFSGSVF